MKITKKIITILVFIVAVLWMNDVFAEELKPYDLLSKNANYYCIQHEQVVPVSKHNKALSATYTNKGTVSIDGNVATYDGKSYSHSDNAKMARILSWGRPVQSSCSYDENDYAWSMKVIPAQGALWAHMQNWKKSVAPSIGLSAGLMGSSKSDLNNYSNIITEAQNYANSIATLGITNQTNSGSIVVSAYQSNGKTFVRVGPFKVKYGGTLNSISILGDNNVNIPISSFGVYNGSNYTTVAKPSSGQNFYVDFELPGNITKIIAMKVTTTQKVYKASITFLENGTWQNLIRYKASNSDKAFSETYNYNIPLVGKIKITKEDSTTHQKLSNIGFTLKMKTGAQAGKYVKQGTNGVAEYTSALSTIYTNKDGIISVNQLLPGSYELIETINPYYGYEKLPKVINSNIVIQPGTENSFTVGNQRKYIKLTGYVWEDIAWTVGKEKYPPNSLYKGESADKNDKLLSNIVVRLRDSNGTEIQKKTTDANGKYIFEDVLIDSLSKYYIEFEYNGMSYQSVGVKGLTTSNGTKAIEGVNRDNFNKKYARIEKDKALDENKNKTYDLKYTMANHASSIKLGDSLKYGYSGQDTKSPVSGTYSQYLIQSNTKNAYNGYLDKIMTPEYIRKNNITSIDNINLGVCKRDQPDVAVIKDLDNVRLTINGYENTYKYAQRFVNQGTYGDGFNVGVKFGEKYGNMSYKRAVYKADYEYVNPKEQNKELQVYLTYRISIKNQSTNLKVAVNEIVDYFDAQYSIEKVGTGIDNKGSVTGKLNYNTANYNANYKKMTIQDSTKIEATSQRDIYVEFKLNRQAVINILNSKETLDNIAEINSYSVYDSNNKVYAGIDQDSNPGNATPGTKSTYEDDTDASPSLTLEVANARSVTGKVFLDKTTGELRQGEIRQGNGQYDNGEKGIQGVKVVLEEITGSGKKYPEDSNNPITTNSEGEYKIEGFIPGDYKITYTWGDKDYTVQQYKGTVVNKEIWEKKQNNKEWYKDSFKQQTNGVEWNISSNEEIRRSDAIDNYEERLKIDEELKDIKYNTTTTIEKMNSTTPIFKVGVEYDTTQTASSGQKYAYQIKSIDFGIAERARQEIIAKKRIAKLKMTLPDGRIIADATIDENGKITGELSQVTYMKPANSQDTSTGFLKVETDNELLQSAIIDTEYEIKVTNNSEIDYISPEFYLYGIKTGKAVAIRPTQILDYADTEWTKTAEGNEGWETKELNDVKDLLAEEVYGNKSKIKDRVILHTEKLKDTEIRPKESATVAVKFGKVLSPTDEISLDNELEIVHVKKDGGREITTTPGNYVPGKGKQEVDDDKAENIIVIPSTGANKNYIIGIIVGVASLIILGAGVIIIKKKMVN